MRLTNEQHQEVNKMINDALKDTSRIELFNAIAQQKKNLMDIEERVIKYVDEEFKVIRAAIQDMPPRTRRAVVTASLDLSNSMASNETAEAFIRKDFEAKGYKIKNITIQE